MRSPAVRFLASAASAVGLTLLVYVARPPWLDVRTDIVGYPTFANFDINRYFWLYGLVAVFLPVVTIGLYVVLTRVFVGSLGPWRPLPAPTRGIGTIPVATGWHVWAVALGRTAFVGGVFGLEGAIWLERTSEVMLATSLGYAIAVSAAGALAARYLVYDRFVVMSVLNAFATPFLVAGLWGVSSSTEVRVAATGDVHAYHWFPAWLAAIACAVLLLVFALHMRWKGRDGVRGLERAAVALVAAPVALYVFMAVLPGELGTFDAYEEGQAVAAAELVRDGAFPWRDLMVSHGLMSDVFRGAVGFTLFDDSRWGLAAADAVLLEPLAWIALYYLCAYLFWTNWLYLVGTQLVILTGLVSAIEIRLILVPIVLLLLAALLRQASVGRAVAFTLLVAVQMIVTPEALVVVLAVVAALVAFEFSYAERGRGVARSYRRTALCLGTALGIAVAWSLFLATFRALDDWAFSFAATVPSHRLTGGIEALVPKTEFEVLAPIALVLVVYAIVVIRVRMRRAFAYQDWVMVAMGLLTVLYFTKFLSRADRHHLDQSFAVVVPLLFYVTFRGVTFGEAWLRRFTDRPWLSWVPRRHTLTLPLLVVLVLLAPEPLQDAVRAAPGHFAADVANEPEVARIGYARPGENDSRLLRSLDDGLRQLLPPGATVFDFSNSPGTLHYLLGRQPSTRYYHVGFAIRKRTQSDLVDRLAASPAGVVVLTSDGAFNSLPAWDGVANQVRHYDVSAYLLDHYVPVRAVDGFVLMVPRAGGATVDPELYFRVDPCDWGYVPNFFAGGPARNAQSVRLPMRRSDDGKRFVVTLPPDAADYGWLEVRSGVPFADGRFELTDRPGGDVKRSIAFRALDRGGTTLRVKVGACSQWRGYRPGVVYLTSDVAQDVDSVRLVR
jgi:hypothetical protein